MPFCVKYLYTLTVFGIDGDMSGIYSQKVRRKGFCIIHASVCKLRLFQNKTLFCSGTQAGFILLHCTDTALHKLKVGFFTSEKITNC